jgi:hypothetical protein
MYMDSMEYESSYEGLLMTYPEKNIQNGFTGLGNR